MAQGIRWKDFNYGKFLHLHQATLAECAEYTMQSSNK